MDSLSRRDLLRWSGTVVLAATLLPTSSAWAGQHGMELEHPLRQPPPGILPGICPNCGMSIAHWGRTRYHAVIDGEALRLCSIHCLADLIRKHGSPAQQVEVALYITPTRMIPAEQATYVLGSRARGTMSQVSKIALERQEEAVAFAAGHGGTLASFAEALSAATAGLDQTYPAIEAARKKSGTIEDPGAGIRCPVCQMFPARYPKHRAQVNLSDTTIAHCCSTQCLVALRAEPKKHLQRPVTLRSAWVTVWPEGGWEYAGGMFFLVGSSIMGPMGPEAIPFRNKSDAVAAARSHGGRVLRYDELLPAEIMARQ
ncbi:MAG: hypothetical protein BWK76_25260 [Desulfobulbaceae bacterium A2]|nr:MAG: hypothetical protein BWK76_25260 [Desulfobulbaceae bacterium A2]